jgi:outer membrane lipoprotein LolB
VWVSAALLGCASVGQPGDPGAESISGRLSVRVDATGEQPARSVSAAFELQGTPDAGRLNLSSPLGTVLAQARWSPRQVSLTTPEGETSFADLNTLTQEMLGESLPVAALFDWLRGRPWSQAPSEPALPPAEAGFRQLGWVIDLARFHEGWVLAQRPQAPKVTVRARIEP